MDKVVVFFSKELARSPGVPLRVSVLHRRAEAKHPGLSLEDACDALLRLMRDYDLPLHASFWKHDAYLTFQTSRGVFPPEGEAPGTPSDVVRRFYSSLPSHALDVGSSVNPCGDTFLHLLAREKDANSVLRWVDKSGVRGDVVNAEGNVPLDLCSADSPALATLTWLTVRDLRKRLRDVEARAREQRALFFCALLLALLATALFPRA